LCLILFVSWHFSLVAFSIFALFSGFGILIMIWCGVFFSHHDTLDFEMPPVHGCLFLYLGNFLLWLH
jgi:hypothetical protein